MDRKRDPRDEKLIKELQEKLDWYTFQASDEDFDAEQVIAIVNLLEQLDPQPEAAQRAFRLDSSVSKAEESGRPQEQGDSPASGGDHAPEDEAGAAFDRFKKRFHITDADIARKDALPPRVPEEGELDIFDMESSAELTLTPEQIRAIYNRKKRANERKNVLSQTMKESLGIPSTAARSTAGGRATEMIAGKSDKIGRVHFLSGVWGKVAIAFTVMIVMGVMLTTATSAVQQKPFFETVQNGVNSFRIIVTGNEMESEDIPQEKNDIIYYNSWDEVLEENSEILTPGYIPEGLSLRELYRRDMGNYALYRGVYCNEALGELLISCKVFKEKYASMEKKAEEGWKLVDENDIVSYYQLNEIYKASWTKGKYVYEIAWIDLNEVNDIVNKMK